MCKPSLNFNHQNTVDYAICRDWDSFVLSISACANGQTSSRVHEITVYLRLAWLRNLSCCHSGIQDDQWPWILSYRGSVIQFTCLHSCLPAFFVGGVGWRALLYRERFCGNKSVCVLACAYVYILLHSIIPRFCFELVLHTSKRFQKCFDSWNKEWATTLPDRMDTIRMDGHLQGGEAQCIPLPSGQTATQPATPPSIYPNHFVTSARLSLILLLSFFYVLLFTYLL